MKILRNGRKEHKGIERGPPEAPRSEEGQSDGAVSVSSEKERVGFPNYFGLFHVKHLSCGGKRSRGIAS